MHEIQKKKKSLPRSNGLPTGGSGSSEERKKKYGYVERETRGRDVRLSAYLSASSTHDDARSFRDEREVLKAGLSEATLHFVLFFIACGDCFEENLFFPPHPYFSVAAPRL